MFLHDQIMNIQEKGLDPDFQNSHLLAYKYGHRDARHAAAELSLKYESLIDRLFCALDMHDIKRVDELKQEYGL